MAASVQYQRIKQVIQELVPFSRVVLFGSRARGDFDSQSDFDLLVILPASIAKGDKLLIYNRIDRSLVNRLRIPVDLILASEEEVSIKTMLPGHIFRSAILEGIEL